VKKQTQYLFQRGKYRTYYVRRRIPEPLRVLYGGRRELIRSLGTADFREASSRATFELASIEAEFVQRRSELALSQASLVPRRIHQLSRAELDAIGRFWARQVLLYDERRREEGLTDDEFEELGGQIRAQRTELGRMLAQGSTERIFPALRAFLHLCGIDYRPHDEAEGRRAAKRFLQAIIQTLDLQLARQSGDPIDTEEVAPACKHPLHVVAPELAPGDGGPGWEEVFEAWRNYVEGRPRSTVIAYHTPWTALRRFAQSKGIKHPAGLTPALMAEFVADMRKRGLAPRTINERLCKVRSIFRVACGKLLLRENPAQYTLGVKENRLRKQATKRLPFDQQDLDRIFGSPIFVEHKRSSGQSGEASYWIPLIMFYTGARPEEIAGLALTDLRRDPTTNRWYFSFVDRPSNEDRYLFPEDDLVPESHRRTLKTNASVRRVPVADELVELGLLRYVEWLREGGSTVFFPTLRKDWHGKLCGSFCKFFGRYKRSVGITDNRKVLYSFRHLMKDLLEQTGMPSKYIKRTLGHTTGEGITEDYGSDLPFELLARYFSTVRFPAIPATPWRPGTGTVRQRREHSK